MRNSTSSNVDVEDHHPRALITGANGFVGIHLANHLELLGWEVYGFDQRATDVRRHFYIGDINDRRQLKEILTEVRPEFIFHLAGIIKSNEPEALYRANMLGTIALCESLMDSGLRPVVVVASSSAVYGHSTGERRIDEKMQTRPMTHYAVSKMAQELAALRYYEAFRLPVKVVRIFNLLGPGQPADLACSSFARQIALSELHGRTEIFTGNLDTQRDFVDVRDAAQALRLIAEMGTAGEVYNVCSGRAVKLSKCLHELTSMSSMKFDVRVDEGRVQQNDIPVQVGNANKLKRVTGWHPRFSLRESLFDLLNDWRERTKSGVEH